MNESTVDAPVPRLWMPVAVSVVMAALFLVSTDSVSVIRPWAANAYLGLSWVPTALFAARAMTGTRPVRWLPAIASAVLFGYLWLWLFQA